MFLMYYDPKAPPLARIASARAAYAARYGAEATLVLVAEGEGAEVAGCEVRESRAGELVVAKGCVAVGRAE